MYFKNLKEYTFWNFGSVRERSVRLRRPRDNKLLCSYHDNSLSYLKSAHCSFRGVGDANDQYKCYFQAVFTNRHVTSGEDSENNSQLPFGQVTLKIIRFKTLPLRWWCWLYCAARRPGRRSWRWSHWDDIPALSHSRMYSLTRGAGFSLPYYGTCSQFCQKKMLM